MASMEDTLREYNAKRAAKAAAVIAQSEAKRVPVMLQKCQQCQAPCTGSIQSLGNALCPDCFTQRLGEQSRTGGSRGP